MKRVRSILINLLPALLIALPCLASVVTSATVPNTRSSGDTITSTIWNNDVLGVYTYLNNNIVPVLNLLTTRGDTYFYNGSSLVRQAVGVDGTVLTAASGQSSGVTWATLVSTTGLTTKGDLLGYNSGAARFPIGADGTTLVADSGSSFGFKWATPTTSIPKGTVTPWSPAAAGTNTIPSGWLLCDGTNSTPNLIGRFVIGSRPSGSTAVGSAGSFPVPTVDLNGAGIISHNHFVGNSIATGGPTSTVTVASGAGVTVASASHIHGAAVAGTSNSVTNEPADYALVYIIKQ